VAHADSFRKAGEAMYDRGVAGDAQSGVWWGKRRRLYNLALLLAGLGSFVAYAEIVSIRGRADSSYEITLFTVVPQAFGYLLAMALANVCFGLGAWCERRLRVTDVERDRFRRWCFGLGLAFSAPNREVAYRKAVVRGRLSNGNEGVNSSSGRKHELAVFDDRDGP
jgi:hypothetical protein